MAAIMMLLGAALAIVILAAIPKVKGAALRAAVVVAAILVFAVFFTLGSIVYVGPREVGIVKKNAFGPRLPEDKILATEGEKGIQASVLPPGWNLWMWPVIYDVDLEDVTEIPQGQIGVLTAVDGRPLPETDYFAPEWSVENYPDAEDVAQNDQELFQRMQEAPFFLENGGYKGPQTSVLRPGAYRINTRLFEVSMVPVTNVEKATVGVIKSNVGQRPAQAGSDNLVERGQRGIWRQPLLPDTYPINPDAYEVTIISTEERTVRYTKAAGAEARDDADQREITVRSSDGFTFPVDVRIEYQIEPQNASLVVAEFRDDGERLADRLNSVVRSVFRNNAEGVKALDYVKQRSQQESQSLAMIAEQMSDFGVTVTGVRIGDVGDKASLGELLKTQTDREIALQEQLTFQEQQRAAEQRKALTRTQQEAEEERRLATAQYEVQIANERKQQQIIQAEAQAESIRIEADAQAKAFQLIAQQIGQGNAALIELLKIVGERGVQITPRVMVVGDSPGASGETTALIGTMLDTMIDRQDRDAREQAQTEPMTERQSRTASPGGR